MAASSALAWRRLLALLALCALAAMPAASAKPARCAPTFVYFASMARTPGNGVAGARLDPCSGRLTALGVVAEVDKPTWVAAPPAAPSLDATSEIDDPAGPNLFAWGVDRATGRLSPLSRTASGGAGPTYLSIDPASRTLFAAHWISGHVSAVPIRADGGLGPPTSIQRGEGSGPRPFQTGPRTHAVLLDPTRRFLLATDIGADRIRIYRFDARDRRLAPAAIREETLPPGTGPRHMLFHPNGRFLYLIDQLSSNLRVYGWDGAAGRLRLLQVQPTVAAAHNGANDAAGIAMSADGRFLYASNRGEDTVVVHAVDPRSGRLTEIQRIASGGKLPRAIAIDPGGKWLLVANQDSNAVGVFARDTRTGHLRATSETLPVTLPAGFAFVR